MLCLACKRAAAESRNRTRSPAQRSGPQPAASSLGAVPGSDPLAHESVGETAAALAAPQGTRAVRSRASSGDTVADMLEHPDLVWDTQPNAFEAVLISERKAEYKRAAEDLLEWPFSADARHDARLLCELVQSLSDNGKETLDMSFFSGDSTFTSCLEQVQEVVAAEGLGHRQWACDVIAAHVLADKLPEWPMWRSTFCISAGPRSALMTAAKSLAYRMEEQGCSFHKPKFGELEEEELATTWILLLEKPFVNVKGFEDFDPTDLGPADVFDEFEKFPPEFDEDMGALGA